MLDRYWHGQTSRISPEAPVPIVQVSTSQESPGGAGNVALNLVGLGAHVQLFGSIGPDEAGETLRKLLQQRGVSTHFMVEPTVPTTTKLRLVSANQQVVRIDFEKSAAALNCANLMQACVQAIPYANLLILSDYNKGCLNHPQLLIQAARQAQIPVLIDPKRRDFSAYYGATLLTPNFKEFTAVVGPCPDEASILEKGFNLITQHHLSALLITRGEHGMTLIEATGDSLTLAARAPEVYDVTGAGDTVIAVLGAALAAGSKLREAAYLANLAAGIVVGQLGATCVTPTQLTNALAQQENESTTGIVSLEQVERIIQYNVQASIGVVVGDFDIVRISDLQTLEHLQDQYAQLIVVVIDQNLTPHHLIHPLEARLTTIAGFMGIDWVTGVTASEWSKFLLSVRATTLFFMPSCHHLMQSGTHPKQELLVYERSDESR